ncbi:hypothetical protein F5Y09DRAFT_301138 [Xylaria sp. FL1042]|nr:hypothetical protein F5Y09DRAFT_301138 [Xylaria sp. FL1042]
MSGSGGFYKYRCKYFYTHECPNWVYVNNTACGECSAQGRDAEPAASQAPVIRYSQEICVPQVEAGVLYYTRMEVETISTQTAGSYWTVRYTANNQTPAQVPTTTSALPGAPTTSTTF